MRSDRTPLAVLVLLGLLAALALGCQSDEEKLAQHLERADAYAEEEAWPEAVIEYKNALQIDPNHAAAHYGLSQAYLQEGKGKEGYWELRETVRLDPSNHEAALQFAQISIFAGELEEALERAEAVIEEDPENVTAYLMKGQAHTALQQPDAALTAFEKAVEIGPENRAALQVLGNFHRRAGDRKTAEPLFRKATEVEPSAQTYLTLASFLAEDRERDAEAEAAYRRALEVAEPGNELQRSYSLLGSFLYSRERFDDAFAALETGIEQAEDPLDLIYLLARMHRAQGNEAKADELAQRATEARPDDPRPYLVLSSYRGREGDLEGALEAAEKAVELAPEDRRARLRKAEVLLELGFRNGDEERRRQGREVVDEVLAEEPSHPGGLFVKAKIDMAENRLGEAAQALRSAIDMRPDWAEAHFLLGTALSLTGERTAARTELARALEIDASLSEARRVLADVHAELGEHAYAVEEGRRYLEEHPGSVETRVRVAQSLVNLGRMDEALREVEAIPEEDRDAQVHYALGRIYAAQGRSEKARDFLLRALEERPAHADILRNLLQVERQLGTGEEAVARIREAVEEHPESAKLQQLAASLALSEGRGADAEESLQKAIELAPEDMSSYRMLADLYSRTGRTGQTIETYEKALEVKPDQPQIHHFLGVLYEFGGQTSKAVEHYEQAIRHAPDLAESKNNLAYLYAEAGENLDRALDLAQDAKAQMPDNPNTADTLGWVLYRRGVPSAAIGYLKEAEAGAGEDDPNLGLIRHHLALAYEASGDEEAARRAVERAIEAHETYVASQKARGVPVGEEPPWFADAREMRERL